MNLIKSFSVYVVNNIINAAIPFILLPILTSLLSPAEYGVLTNFQVFITFSLPFIMLAIQGAINVAYFREDKERFPSYVSSSFLITVASTFIMLVILLLASPLIKSYLGDVNIIWILIVPFICLFQTFSTVVLTIFQAKKEPVKYGIYQIGLTLTNLILSIVFVAVFDMNWTGRLLGILASFFIFFLISLIVLRKSGYLTKHVSKDFVKDALMFGAPLIPHLISGPIIQMLDRPFITHFKGIEWAGIYASAFQLGIAVNYVADAFNKAWIPYLFGEMKNADWRIKKKIVKQSYLFMLLFLLMPVLLYLITPLLYDLHVIDPQYADGMGFVLPVSIGAAFAGMYYIVADYIFYVKKTFPLMFITFGSAILSVALNILLIPILGTIGAAYTYIIVNVLIFIAVWILSNRVYPMPWFSFWKKAQETPEEKQD